LEKLNLPDYSFSIKETKGKLQIFDKIRKKYVALTPEEWVRQNFVTYLIQEKQYPETLISIEMLVTLNKLQKRCDIAVFNSQGRARAIVECKATNVIINQETFNQIVMYNMKLQVNYLIVTNGLKHYCCKINYNTKDYTFLSEIPVYEQLN